MRIDDIVKQATAARFLASSQAQRRAASRTHEAHVRGEDQGKSAQAIEQSQRSRRAEATGASGSADRVELSNEALVRSSQDAGRGRRGKADEGQVEVVDDQDDPIGAIIERFVRQRQVTQISLPIGGGGSGFGGTGFGAGMFSLTIEVEEAYRVIEFVPRSAIYGPRAENQGAGVDVQG